MRALRETRLVCQSTTGGVELLERHAPAWRQLCAEGPCEQPFYRPEWVGSHLRAFEPGARLRLVTVHGEGRLRAVLPLVEEWTLSLGVPMRRLRGAAGVHAARFDLVHGGDVDEVAPAIWSHLRDLPGWDVIETRDVPEGGGMERVLAAAEREGHPVGRWESMRTPHFALPPASDGIEVLLRSRNAKFASNLRRRRRRLEEKGEVALRRWDVADPAAIEAFYELERCGWKGQRGTAIACSDATRAFYDRAARWAAEEGIFALYALELDGRPVAMHWGLQQGDRYFLPKPAFDEALAACSPGQLLLREVAADLMLRGVRTFDFLGPWMEWKADWTDAVLPHHFLYVFRKSAWGRLLHAAKFRARPWIEASAPLASLAWRAGLGRPGGRAAKSSGPAPKQPGQEGE